MMHGDYSGDCVIELVDAGTHEERVVVIRADSYVRASVELIREWRVNSGNGRVKLRGNRVTFGTSGEGVGEVAYVLGEVPDDPPVRVVETPTVPMRRVL